MRTIINADKLIKSQRFFRGHRSKTAWLDIKLAIFELYHKRGKIHWVKNSWFQPYEVFRGNTFVVHCPPVFITYLKLKIHGKTFTVSSKTMKTAKVYPSEPFLIYGNSSKVYVVWK